jgi:type I restriction enzyme M protein
MIYRFSSCFAVKGAEDAGSGESEIRRFILENDLLEALIALPEQLFYNTGIATYVWVVTNRKMSKREGLVQLINRKSLGDKRREIPVERAQEVLKILSDFADGDRRVITKEGQQEEVVVSKIFPTAHFGYRKITVDRPLRLNFQATADRIARLEEERRFQALAESRKKGAAGEKEKVEGRAQQEAISAHALMCSSKTGTSLNGSSTTLPRSAESN